LRQALQRAFQQRGGRRVRLGGAVDLLLIVPNGREDAQPLVVTPFADRVAHPSK